MREKLILHSYTDLLPKLVFKPDKGVIHRQTCPECGRKLVNLYKRGNVWKCRRCWEEAMKNEGD